MYSVPIWYRVCMVVIAATVAGAIATAPGRPAPLAWIILVLAALAGLYEERWSFEPASRRVVHRAGLLVAAKTLRVNFDEIERFRLVPQVRGTIPGSEDERLQNAAALQAGRSDDSSRRRSSFKKPYVSLVFDCADGTRYLIDRTGARRINLLRRDAESMASLCGKPLLEG